MEKHITRIDNEYFLYRDESKKYFVLRVQKFQNAIQIRLNGFSDFSLLPQIMSEVLTEYKAWCSDCIAIYIERTLFQGASFKISDKGNLCINQHNRELFDPLILWEEPDFAIKHYIVLLDCTFKWCDFEPEVFKKVEFPDCIFMECEGYSQGFIECPSDGEFFGWKSCGDYIVKLRIPKDAKRTSGNSVKCRCEFADVVRIYDYNGDELPPDFSVYNDVFSKKSTEYKVGKRVYADSFDDSTDKICTHGIHFYLDKRVAAGVFISGEHINRLCANIDANENKYHTCDR